MLFLEVVFRQKTKPPSSAKATLAEVAKEMARPRVAMSAREPSPELRSARRKSRDVPRTVAFMLDRERNSVIAEWLRRVNLVSELANIPLSDADRAGHLPQLFAELITRLRLGKDAPLIISISAMTHGKERFSQGYTAAMLVEESRIFEVSAFSTLHLHRSELDQTKTLLAVIIIADEADRQLTDTVRGFMMASENPKNSRSPLGMPAFSNWQRIS